jgi:hypothetical protein
MERSGMGVGSRNLGATAVSQGQVVFRPLGPGPPARGLSVGWRTLALRSGRACQVSSEFETVAPRTLLVAAPRPNFHCTFALNGRRRIAFRPYG